MFEIGQRVVCIQQSKAKLLVVGKEYIVKDIHECSIGGFIDIGSPTVITVCSCGHGSTRDNYFFFKYFAPIEDMEEATEAVNKLIKEVNQTIKV